MFREHSNVIWGTCCDCGNECYILQNKFHPWDQGDFIVYIKCPECGKILEIDKVKAEKFYNNKILSYFSDLEGTIMDMGCGGGFLTNYAASNDRVNKIFSVDKDEDCASCLNEIPDPHNKIEFISMDIGSMSDYFSDNSLDYIISRDVFMFIENIEGYFKDVERIVRRGVLQMGWYKGETDRMKNNLMPDQIADRYKSMGWDVEIEYLDWYKCGYFIKAMKK